MVEADQDQARGQGRRRAVQPPASDLGLGRPRVGGIECPSLHTSRGPAHVSHHHVAYHERPPPHPFPGRPSAVCPPGPRHSRGYGQRFAGIASPARPRRGRGLVAQGAPVVWLLRFRRGEHTLPGGVHLTLCGTTACGPGFRCVGRGSLRGPRLGFLGVRCCAGPTSRASLLAVSG